MCTDDLCNLDTTTTSTTHRIQHFHIPSLQEEEEEEEEDQGKRTCEMLPECMSDQITHGLPDSNQMPMNSNSLETTTDPTWLVKKDGLVVPPDDWGMPGFLTKNEFDVFVRCFFFVTGLLFTFS